MLHYYSNIFNCINRARRTRNYFFSVNEKKLQLLLSANHTAAV